MKFLPNINLSDREKVIVLPIFFVLLIFLIIQFLFLPLSEKNDRLAKEIQDTRQDILTVQEYGSRLLQLKKKLRKLRTTELQRSVLAIVEQSGIEENPNILQNIQEKGSQSLVLKFDELRNDQLTLLVYNIERHTPVIIIESMDILSSLTNEKNIRANLTLRSE